MKLTLDTLRHYAEEEGECWLWRASITSSGYPQAYLDGRNQRVQTYIFATLQGRTHQGGRVMAMACQNKRCINPDHIRSHLRGYVQQRVYANGLRNPAAEYTGRLKARAASPLPICSPELVARIRSMPAEMTHAEVARQVGVGHKCVSRIRRGITHRTQVANSSVWSLAA